MKRGTYIIFGLLIIFIAILIGFHFFGSSKEGFYRGVCSPGFHEDGDKCKTDAANLNQGNCAPDYHTNANGTCDANSTPQYKLTENLPCENDWKKYSFKKEDVCKLFSSDCDNKWIALNDFRRNTNMMAGNWNSGKMYSDYDILFGTTNASLVVDQVWKSKQTEFETIAKNKCNPPTTPPPEPEKKNEPKSKPEEKLSNSVYINFSRKISYV